MKIALLNNLYKPYQKGGAEKITEILASELRADKQSVFVIATKPKGAQDLNEENDTYYLTSNYYHLNEHSTFYRLFWHLANLFNYKKYQELKRIFKIETPDLIISNNLMGLGLLSLLAIAKTGARHIHIIHDIQLLHPSGLMYFGKEEVLNSPLAKLYQTISSIMFNANKKTVIISPSKWLLEVHKKQGLFLKNKSTVVTNPFKTKIFPKSEILKNSFLFIGQLEHHKGIDLFTEAAKRFKNFNFIVIGDGSLKEKIASDSNLRILGKKNSQEINDLLNQSLALIVPSRCYENSPTVIYEAAALGVPVIAANLGGIPELVNRFGGLLFEPDNLDSLIMTITQFLEKDLTPTPPQPEEDYAKRILEQLKISA